MLFRSADGFEWAIRRAFEAARHDVLSRIEISMADLMPHAVDHADNEQKIA